MTAPLQKTIADELQDRIGEVLSTNRLIPASDSTFVELMDGASKLAEVDVAGAESIRGLVFSLAGDVDRAESAFLRSLDLDDNPFRALNYAAAMGNLGQFTKAQHLFRKYGSPTAGFFSQWGHLGYVAGAFESLARFADQAGNKMKMKLTPEAVEAAAVASILARLDVSEERLGQWLDVAGDMMRDRGLCFAGPTPLVRAYAIDEDALDVCFLVAMEPREAALMNFQLAEKIVADSAGIPVSLSISFRGIGAGQH